MIAIKLNIMKNTYKTLFLFSIILFNCSYAQNTILRNVNNAKLIEINKQEFIGKPLKSLLHSIKLPIKSVVPIPNKNPNEVNRIRFIFIPYNEYKNSNQNTITRKTSITVIFNQNSELIGDKCKANIPDCISWTKKDENNLGSLIISDIYVTGKD
jgi:hypothetical protein